MFICSRNGRIGLFLTLRQEVNMFCTVLGATVD